MSDLSQLSAGSKPSSWVQKWLGEDAVGLLGRGAVTTLLVNVAAGATGLILHIVLTWALASEAQYGLYLIAIATINLLAIQVVGGWDTALTRFWGQSPRAEDDLLAGPLLRLATRRVIRNAAIVLTAVVILGTFAYREGWLDTGKALLVPGTLVIGLGTVPVLALCILRQGALRGLHRPAWSLVPEALLTPLLVMTLTVGLIALGAGSSGGTAILAYGLAACGAFVFGTCLLPAPLRRASLLLPPRQLPHGAVSSDTSMPTRLPLSQVPRETRSEWSSLARSALIVALAFTILNRIDEWLLGLLDSPAAAGLYGPASRYAGFVIFGLSAVNPVFGPLVARHQHDREELQRLAKRAARFAAVLSTPVALLFMAAPWVPLSLHPEPYLQTMCVLRVLAAAQWLNTLFGNAGMLLSMTGHHRDLAIVLVLTALLDIGLNIVLIPIFGYLGAAIATGTSIVAWNLAAWCLVKWRLGVSAGAI